MRVYSSPRAKHGESVMQVVLLRVGIDSGSGGMQGPLLKNDHFEYIPIPDTFQNKGVDKRTYGNTKGRYAGHLIDYFPNGRRKKLAKQPMHFDPEFGTFTYGDPTTVKGSLRKLVAGDLLVFYCGLSKWNPRKEKSKHNHNLYMIGYFVVQEAGYASEFTQRDRDKLFRNNFHVMHKQVFQKQKGRLVLVKGSKKSRLLKKAIKISSNGKDRNGNPLKVISPKMRKIFGNFGGALSIQRSGPKWVESRHVTQAARFVTKRH